MFGLTPQKKQGMNEQPVLGQEHIDDDGNLYIYVPGGWQNTYNRDFASATFTNSQRFFWVFDPRMEDIYINDIAHGMANECRYGGQSPYHYSVAWHSYVLSLVVPEKFAKLALMHDASEAYFKDLQRPLKNHPDFTHYREAENHLMDMVYQKYGLDYFTVEDHAAFKFYDVAMSVAECIVFWPTMAHVKFKLQSISDGYINAAEEWLEHIQQVTPETAKLSWMLRFNELYY